jgi:sigma-B regulation protein RsbU (phosphoserine phosphatase)
VRPRPPVGALPSGVKYNRVDTAGSSEVAELNELFRVASTLEKPTQVLQHFGAWYGRKRPTDFFMSIARRDLPDFQYKVTRLLSREMRERIADQPAANPWRDWDSLPVYEGGLVGDILEHGGPQLLTDLDAGDDPHFGAHLASVRSVMAVPQYHEGRAINWALSFYEDPAGPNAQHLADAVSQTSLLGMATRNLVSKRHEEKLNAELTHQFEQIANIQRSLLPQKTPDIPGLKIATAYMTSDRAGGDYYDFFPFPDGTWGILIADVSGHGPAAATVMAMLRAILHCYTGEDFSPAKVMRFANEKLAASNLDGSFVTAFFAVYDPQASTISWARCGHNPPLLKTPGAGVRELNATGVPPLGVLPDLEPEQETIEIRLDETLILYTDGITESFSEDRVMFGVRGVIESLEHCDGQPDCVVDSIYGALYKHTGSMDRDDDQTLVALRRVPIEPGSAG